MVRLFQIMFYPCIADVPTGTRPGPAGLGGCPGANDSLVSEYVLLLNCGRTQWVRGRWRI